MPGEYNIVLRTVVKKLLLCCLHSLLLLIPPFLLQNICGYKAIRKRVNELRNEANRFREQVDILSSEAEGLRQEVESLEGNNARLENIVSTQNSGNVDEFVSLVMDNQNILHQMKVGES